MPGLETEAQFKSFEEATGALRFMLMHLEAGRNFSADEAFEIAEQAIKLKSIGDKTSESQKENMIRDLASQKREFAGKYEASDEAGKVKLIENLRNSMENNFLKALERH